MSKKNNLIPDFPSSETNCYMIKKLCNLEKIVHIYFFLFNATWILKNIDLLQKKKLLKAVIS